LDDKPGVAQQDEYAVAFRVECFPDEPAVTNNAADRRPLRERAFVGKHRAPD
jgi:hypothetical protein